MASLLNSYLKLIRRLFPANAHNSLIGVDISPSACKMVEVSAKRDGFELMNWAVEPLVEQDEKSIPLALEKVAADLALKAKPRPVIAALSGKGTLVRYVDMPKMSVADLQRAFAIEADKYFPFPKDTVNTDCYILDQIDGGRKISVLVAAAKKDMVEARIKLFKDCGLDLLALSLNSVALANAFSLFPPAGFSGGAETKSFKACAVVNISETSTNLMIIFAGTPRFNRDIFIGTQEMYKRVANMLGVSTSEVKILFSPGLKLKEAVQKGIEEVMHGLISEIRLSFDYFVTEKNVAVTQIFLTGEGALISGVEQSFKDGLDIPVQVWDPFEQIKVSDSAQKEGLKANASRLIIALGLAINEYDQT